MAVGLRRSDLEIIRDILRMDGEGPTQLRYNANLSYPQLQKYLGFLEQSALIQRERHSAHVLNVQVTEKGRKVLTLLDALFTTLGYESLSEDEKVI